MNSEKTLAELLNESDKRREQGNWIPASNGTEKPFLSRSGMTLMYCYQPSTGKHAYLNCETDIFLDNEEAFAALSI